MSGQQQWNRTTLSSSAGAITPTTTTATSPLSSLLQQQQQPNAAVHLAGAMSPLGSAPAPFPLRYIKDNSIIYPTIRRDDSAIDVYHGNEIKDPYRVLENLSADETKRWIEEQIGLTTEYLETFCRSRRTIARRLSEMYNYEKIGVPFKRGSNIFYFRNDGLQNQFVLYKQHESGSPPEVFVDPNTFSTDGTAALGVSKFSKDGAFYAYGVSRSGSDWQTLLVKDVATGKDFPERLEWCKFSSIAWRHDNKGFFYSRYDPPDSLVGSRDDGSKRGAETDQNKEQKVYYHRLGTMQSDDELIYASPANPKWLFGVNVTDDGKFLMITISESTALVNRLYLVRLDEIQYKDDQGLVIMTKLINNFDARFSYITNDDTLFYFLTNLHAPRNKIVSIDIASPACTNWRDIIPQHEADNLEDAECVHGSFLLLEYIHDVRSVLKLYSLSGQFVENIALPGIGVVTVSGRREDSELFYRFTSFLHPGTIFKYNCQTRQSSIYYETRVHGFDPTQFKTEQVWYQSRDGTKIPMFLVSHKDIKTDGHNPTLLYGYGGFSISMLPFFSTFTLAFIHHYRAIFALANIRGGGEFGEEWHKSGILENKQNVFDDFICAAEWLIKNKYTSADKIVIEGGSNGGLLVGACINQRPDLFRCAIAKVGVMDMLKFHKFTIGYAWVADYGSSDDAKQFHTLIKYSPLHNIRVPEAGKQYPAVLCLTSDHDDRVVPLHSFKYVATLQNAIGKFQSVERPLLIRIETKAGHGSGKPTSKFVEEYADAYAFIGACLKCEWIS